MAWILRSYKNKMNRYAMASPDNKVKR